MSARDAEETTVSSVNPTTDLRPAPPVRPSWDTAPAARPVSPPSSPAAPPASRPVSIAAAEAPRPYYAAPPPVSVPPLSAVPEYSQEAVQYDLAGNPVSGSGSAFPSGQSQSAHPPAQAGAPAVWPPQPTVPYGVLEGGHARGNGTDHVAQLKWNWGAFLLPFWWCCFNGQKNLAWVIFGVNTASRYIPAPFSYLLGVADLGIRIYLGLVGHRLSWASGRAMGDYDDFIRTQRVWMIWGFVVDVVLLIAAAVFFGMLAGLSGSSGTGFGHSGGSGSPMR